MTQVPCIEFSQYGAESPGDDLLVFAAPAKALINWAGIPRKAWHIRMLFQRPITAGRAADLKRFWDDASKGGSEGFALGPTAIVVAIQGEPTLVDGKIDLSATSVVDVEGDPRENLKILSERLYPQILSRLSDEQRELLAEYEEDPFDSARPDIEHDYVFEFALQMAQMRADPDRFALEQGIDDASLTQITVSMEALCRPALVVDGQHRLYGAANAERDINLPVVAIPHCNWMDQIYQFVVINETAQKVETSLLTDIFGSSLTRTEQEAVRKKLAKARVDVESRIAAVVASRDLASPFYNMVSLKLEGQAPPDVKAFLTERTVRNLIEGSSGRLSRGWRSDETFYSEFVSPTIPVREEWESWTDGRWREYWIAFWDVVKTFYNSQAKKVAGRELWLPTQQTNLTKAVTLRALQSLFITKCVERMREIDATVGILRETLGEEEADQKVTELRLARALPADIDQFRTFVHDFFLERGVPVKVFLTDWKTSLDDAEGQKELWETLETAFERTKKGERFPVKGRIFVASEDG